MWHPIRLAVLALYLYSSSAASSVLSASNKGSIIPLDSSAVEMHASIPSGHAATQHLEITTAPATSSSTTQSSLYHITTKVAIERDLLASSRTYAISEFFVTTLVTGNRNPDEVVPPRATSTALNLKSQPPFKVTGAWATIDCAEGNETDAAIPGEKRWAAADSDNALLDIVNAYRNPDFSRVPGELPLDFPTFLFNIFHFGQISGRRDPEDGGCMDAVSCSQDVKPAAAAHYITNCVIFLHRIAAQLNTAIKDAHSEVNDRIEEIVSTFAPQHDSDATDVAVIKTLIDILTLGVGVGSAVTWNVVLKDLRFFEEEPKLHGAFKDSFNAAVTFGTTTPKDNLDDMNVNRYNAVNLSATLKDYLIEYSSLASKAVTAWLENAIEFPPEDDGKTLIGLLEGGGMLEAQQQRGIISNTSDAGITKDVVTNQKQLFYGLVIPIAWSISPENFHPFIVRIDREIVVCPGEMPHQDPASELGTLESLISSNIMKNARYCDPQGNSWFLLSAKQQDQQCATDGTCLTEPGTPQDSFQIMDGMEKLSSYNLTVADMILSSWGGFVLNDFKNGYQMDLGSAKIVLDNMTIAEDSSSLNLGGGIRTPGFFNFPICLDWKEVDHAIPKKGGSWPEHICGISPSTAGVLTPFVGSSDYVPDWCVVHIKQYQKNEGDENRWNVFQTTITIHDASGRPAGEGNKEPNGDPVVIVDSALPHDLIVATGAFDSDPIQFWYGDQYWDSNSKDHQCGVGGYDSGHRDMDCGFSCPLPASGDPPASATIAHPLTGIPKPGATGADVFSNAWDVPFPTGTSVPSPAPSEWKPTYKQGQCYFHLSESKPHAPDNNSDKFGIEVEVYPEDNSRIIGYNGQTEVAVGDGIGIHGEFQYILGVIVNKDGDGPLTFKYGGDTWTTDTDGRCKVGNYDNNWREMDCSFQC